ncbi:hypothetical protein BH20ACI2_BH20ACI2_09840 [soil metagenome]
MVRNFLQVLSLITISLGFRLAIGAVIAVNCFVAVPHGDGLQRKDLRAAIKTLEEKKEAEKPRKKSVEQLTTSPDDFIETIKLFDQNSGAASQLGFSVAISGDTAIIGAPGDANNKGAALIFQRSGNTWDLQQKIIGSDSAADDHFGWSVAISGETAVVGAYDLNEVDSGAAYVFVRGGLTWSQQQKLTPSDGSVTDQFGSSVSISGDTIAVGAFGNGSFRGAAYIFTRNGVSWIQEQKLTATDAAVGDDFGWSVALSGSSAVVGAPGDDSSRGGLYVFVRNGTSWAQIDKITASDGTEFDRFGYSVSIDGDYLISGAPLGGSNAGTTGSAYIFSRSGSNWLQQQKLVPADGEENDKFGGSVGLNGSIAVIGSNGDDIATAVDQGSAYIFTRVGSTWSQKQKLTGSESSVGDNFGGSVAVRQGAVIAGAYLDDVDSTMERGTAYIFTDPEQPTPTPSSTPTPGPMAIVSGRVFTSGGLGLRNAIVTATDQAIGSSKTVSTSSLGYFFIEVESGRNYIISVNSKRYRYSSIPISVNGDISDLDFIGLE